MHSLALICFGLSSIACTTALYNGPGRAATEVAIISCGRNATIASIDGVPVNGGGLANYVVLPGAHIVDLEGKRTEIGVFSNTVHRSQGMRTCFVAEAGHAYDVRATLSHGYWSSQTVDRESAGTVDEGGCGEPGSDVYGRDVSAAVLANPPHPGTGFFLALGGDVGGDNVVSASMSNGSSDTLDAGSGVYGALGASFTPLWLGDVAGLGLGGRIGVKLDSIDASNGSITLTRYPFSVWLHSYLRLSERWYFLAAGGAHKELGASLSGDGVASSFQANFQSPWGWLVDAGFVFAETWHTALGFTVRYTHMRYTIAGQVLDASNVGAGLTLSVNP